MENLEKLTQLKQLLDEGILTQKEFETRKNQILFPEKIEEEKRKLEEEKRRQEEEKKRHDEEMHNNVLFDAAIRKFDIKTSDSFKQGIAELEKLGSWRDANLVVLDYKDELAEIEKAEEEERAEKKRADLYDNAIKKFDIRTVPSFRSAIADLESLGDYRDAAEVIEEHRPQLEELEKEENQKKQKLRKKLILAAAGIAAVILIFVIAKILMTPDFSKFTPTENATINTMSYKIPSECKLEDSKQDVYALYSLRKNDKVIGAVEIEYRGENDLSGAATYNTKESDHIAVSKAKKLVPDGTDTYQTVTADHSVFEVTVYANDDKVKGKAELVKAIADSFDANGYKNPRTFSSILAIYTGDKSAGVTIDKNTDGLAVKEQYLTALGAGTKTTTSYTVEKPVKLEGGKTSKVKIKASDKEFVLEVSCSDRGAFYKDGKFTASLDDIMAVYTSKYDAVHLYSSSTSAGAHLNIIKKDESYGGKLHCDTTNRDAVIVFSSVAADGDKDLPADEKPGRIIFMIQSDSSAEVEDLMCFVGAFANLFCTLDPSIEQDAAYQEMKDTVVDGTSDKVHTFKGLNYRYVESSGIYILQIE